MTRAVILSAVRTPFGRYGGGLAGVRPDDLAAHVIAALVERADIDPARIDDVILGAANQAGEDNRNVAPHGRAARRAARQRRRRQTVNRLCGSGMQAVVGARACRRRRRRRPVHRRRRRVDDPRAVRDGQARAAFPRGKQTLYDTTLGWRFTNPRLAERYCPLLDGRDRRERRRALRRHRARSRTRSR